MSKKKIKSVPKKKTTPTKSKSGCSKGVCPVKKSKVVKTSEPVSVLQKIKNLIFGSWMFYFQLLTKIPFVPLLFMMIVREYPFV